MPRLLCIAAVIALVFFYRAPAYACSTCGCGDPTLTSMGAEKPLRNRLRLALDARFRTDRLGEANVDQIKLSETRVDALVAWAPTERFLLVGAAPVLHRSLTYVNAATTTSFGLGDVELRGKMFVFADRAYSPRHLYAVQAGLKLPTAARNRDEAGLDLPIEAQPGTGSWDPSLGMSYAFFAAPWSFYASVMGSAPIRGTDTYRASASLRTTTTLQYQFSSVLAARLGVDTRTDTRSFEGGKPERDSSGFIGLLSPELIVSPRTDLLLVASVRVPVVQHLAGFHREGPYFGLAVVYDL